MDGENPSSPSPRLLCRAGSLSAVALATGYVAIVALYVAIGAPPTATATLLDHLARHSRAWWAIVGLSVFTDLLFLPVVAALDPVGRAQRGLMRTGAALFIAFVILDLAVTWPAYAALIDTSGRYAVAEAGEKASLLGAATYPAAVLGSPLFSVYAILLPSLGILAIAAATLRARIDSAAGYVGIATGILGVVAVVGPIVSRQLGAAAIAASVLTTAWLLLIARLLWLHGRRVASEAR
jgi:hypothetical protein